MDDVRGKEKHLSVSSGCCFGDGKGRQSSRRLLVGVPGSLRVFIHGVCKAPLLQAHPIRHIWTHQKRSNPLAVLFCLVQAHEEKHGGFQVCNLFLPRRSLLFDQSVVIIIRQISAGIFFSLLYTSFVFNAIYLLPTTRFKWRRCHLDFFPTDSLTKKLFQGSLC